MAISYLEKYLEESPAEEYLKGEKIDFASKYRVTRDYLIKNFYNDIAVSARGVDPEIILNNHGLNHIDTVIFHASNLAQAPKCKLTPYEVYLLLISILFHDIGNIFKRSEHEKTARIIMNECRELYSYDSLEAMIIAQIVDAHGGKNDNGDRDKIFNLPEDEPMVYGKVRIRFIAAILRFADELADDNHRASIGLLKQELITEMSKIYHVYSQCLITPIVNHEDKSIRLQYNINKKDLKDTFGEKKVYLIDEIHNRLMKMHVERIYFMRYAKTWISIEKIHGVIRIYSDIISEIKRISFELVERGYPEINTESIFSICPDFTDSNGEKMDGRYFDKLLENRNEVSING